MAADSTTTKEFLAFGFNPKVIEDFWGNISDAEKENIFIDLLSKYFLKNNPNGSGGHTFPVLINQPILSTVRNDGTFRLGDTISCSTGSWLNALSFQYQWYKDAVPIGGENSSNYLVLNEDLGSVLACRVTAFNNDDFAYVDIGTPEILSTTHSYLLIKPSVYLDIKTGSKLILV